MVYCKHPSSRLLDLLDGPKSPSMDSEVRIGAAAAGPGRSPCPNRTSALEKAIHGFAENPGDDVIVPALGTSFDCLSEAFDYCHWT